MDFYKYEGTGNDFILFDHRADIFRGDLNLFIAQICNRRYGIGADGVMLLEKSESVDFEMIYYNADGNKGSMCGNGARCMVSFVQSLGILRERYHFNAADGLHEAFITNNIVHLKMRDVENIKHEKDHFEIHTGSPHYIEFVKDITHVNVKERGIAIRYSEEYNKDGINVNFIEPSQKGIKIRTYERGVEDETFSCGTGVTAGAITYAIYEKYPAGNHSIEVETKGGKLQVTFDKLSNGIFKNIWLIGPAKFVFKGTINSPVLK